MLSAYVFAGAAKPATNVQLAAVACAGSTEPVARRMVTPLKSASSGLTHPSATEWLDESSFLRPVTGLGAVISAAGETVRRRRGLAKAAAPAAPAVWAR